MTGNLNAFGMDLDRIGAPIAHFHVRYLTKTSSFVEKYLENRLKSLIYDQSG